MKNAHGAGEPHGRRRRGNERDWLKVSEDFLGKLAERFLADVDRFAAIGTVDGVVFEQRVENHVFEGVAVAEGKMGAFIEHTVENFLDAGFRRGRQPAGTTRAQQFDLHDFHLRSWDFGVCLVRES